jgi:hypothetical protein
MALIFADRVRETTTTTGTGTITLAGAVVGYQSFGAIGNGNTTYYTINAGDQWEVGIGTYSSSGTSLTRTTVLSSSNGDALVNFAAGVKDVFVTYPADKTVIQYENGNVAIGLGAAAPGEKLSVGGVIESTTGGFKYPDDTIQTTAATTTTQLDQLEDVVIVAVAEFDVLAYNQATSKWNNERQERITDGGNF